MCVACGMLEQRGRRLQQGLRGGWPSMHTGRVGTGGLLWQCLVGTTTTTTTTATTTTPTTATAIEARGRCRRGPAARFGEHPGVCSELSEALCHQRNSVMVCGRPVRHEPPSPHAGITDGTMRHAVPRTTATAATTTGATQHQLRFQPPQ